MVGAVVRETGIRDKITLATKVPLALGNRSSYTTGDMEELRKTHGQGLEKKLHEDYLDTFSTSLRRLQLDSVDILYVHSVKDPATITWPFLLDALGKLKHEGKVRFLGVSTHQNEVPIIDQATKSGSFDVILAPLNFKTSRRNSIAAALERAHKRNIGIVAMKTQAIYDSSKETNHTAALKYVLRHECVCTAIPGFTSFDELEEDFSVARNLAYTADEERYLRDFRANASLGKVSGTCERCGQCQPGCPRQANIPDLMRTYMYAAGYKNFEHARITYESIPAGENLSACDNCTTCRANCVNGLNIPSNIRQLKAIYRAC
jgi:predicted aldo/keto reductase-like oxidoreductase